MNLLWTSIQYVTGIFTLVAFVVAAFAFVRLRQTKRGELAIRAANKKDIPLVLEILEGQLRLDTTSLSGSQKLKYIVTQLDHTRARYQVFARYGLAALVVLAVVSVLAGMKVEPPAPLEAKGTGEARLAISPQGRPFAVHLTATAETHISENGQAHLTIYVNDDKTPCESSNGNAYWTWSVGVRVHSTEIHCSIVLERYRAYDIKATNHNHNADSHSVKLVAQFE